MRFTHKLLSAAFLCALAARAHADSATTLQPFLNDDTIVVIDLDASQIDPTAFEKMFIDFIAPVAAQDPTLPEAIHNNGKDAATFFARFKQLGARHVYMVYAQGVAGPTQSPFLLIPLEPGGNIKDLSTLVDNLSMIPNDPVQVSDTLLAVDLAIPLFAQTTAPADPGAAFLKQLKAIVPSPRPDLEKALAASNAPFQLAAALSNSHRKFLLDNMPTLPPELGGGSTDIYAKSLQFVTLSITPPPAQQITLTLQSDSPANASLTAGALTAAFKQLDTSADVKLAEILNPKVTDSAVIVDLAAEKIHAAADALLPKIIAARKHAHQVISQSNIRLITMAAIMYANQNNDAWPDTLKALIGQGVLTDEKSLLNSNDPKHRPYIYQHWTTDEIHKLSGTDAPTVWEDTDDDASPIIVGYLDGHVDTVADKKTLTKQLDDAKAAAKKQ